MPAFVSAKPLLISLLTSSNTKNLIFLNRVNSGVKMELSLRSTKESEICSRSAAETIKYSTCILQILLAKYLQSHQGYNNFPQTQLQMELD